MSKMTVGVNLYSLRDQCKDAAGFRYTLARLGEIGYTAVQVSGVALEPEVIAGLIKESGLTCAATHMPWAQVRDDTERVIKIHQMYGCRHAAIGGLPQEYIQTPTGLDRFSREIPVPAQKLADAGLSFSYHNHHHEFIRIGGRAWLEMLYERIGSEYLCAEIDTYWIQTGGGDPAKWIRRMAGREPLLHVKDKVIAAGGEQRFAPVGSGNLDWPEILGAADESGVEYVLVEQDDMYGSDPFECVESSYRFLASMGLS